MRDDESQAVENDVAMFMDLLSHDILNSNQAVLSYLDLISESPNADDKTRHYAAKAASQIRTSSMLIENLKGIVAVLRASEVPSTRTPLREAIDRSARRTRGLFPDKRIELDVSGIQDDAEVLGGADLVQQLLDNLLMNSVQLDHGEAVKVRLDAGREVVRGEGFWKVTVRVPEGTLPETSATNLASWLQVGDTSKMVRISGFLFASMVAEALGGSFEPHSEGEGRGCSFGVLLREAPSL